MDFLKEEDGNDEEEEEVNECAQLFAAIYAKSPKYKIPCALIAHLTAKEIADAAAKGPSAADCKSIIAGVLVCGKCIDV